MLFEDAPLSICDSRVSGFNPRVQLFMCKARGCGPSTYIPNIKLTLRVKRIDRLYNRLLENAFQVRVRQFMNEESFGSSVTQIVEPQTNDEAMADPVYARQWRDAIETEIMTLQSYKTWEYCVLPRGKRAIGCKWVFRIKYNEGGKADKFRTKGSN